MEGDSPASLFGGSGEALTAIDEIAFARLGCQRACAVMDDTAIDEHWLAHLLSQALRSGCRFARLMATIEQPDHDTVSFSHGLIRQSRGVFAYALILNICKMCKLFKMHIFCYLSATRFYVKEEVRYPSAQWCTITKQTAPE